MLNDEVKKDVETKDETPKEKLPFLEVVKNTVYHFAETSGYTTLGIAAGIAVGIFVYVKYKRKK